MRALLVVNPHATATTSRARDVLAHALASESRLEVVETKKPGHATELAASAVGEFDVVVALGGDGTVNEVVNGLLAEGVREGLPALAVVPGGSTNVFARALGLPDSPVEATGALLDALRYERRRSVGLARADDRWFTFNAGLGLDAEVVRGVDVQRSVGRRPTPARYVRAGVRHFLSTSRRPLLALHLPGAEPVPLGARSRLQHLAVDLPGHPARRPVPAGVVRHRAGPVRAAPARHAVDVAARPPDPVAGAAAVRPPAARAARRAELVLTAERPQPFQVDGEDLGDRSRVVLRSVPAALSVVV